VHVFVGPTLAAQDVAAAAPGATIHPPVAHGDLLRLDLGPGDTAVIVDGYFHHVASVRHKEILWLLAKRVRVIGCASMGALRAAELAPYGMVGNGVVFEMYRDGTIDADDEVAVPHTEDLDYRKLGVPLVNVRHAVAAAQRAGVLADAEAAAVVAAGQALHYTGRSWRDIELALTRDNPQWTMAAERLRAFLAEHPEHADVKAADVIDTLNRLDELGRQATAGSGEWVNSAAWQNRLLCEWRVDFAGTWIDANHVSQRAILHFQQIYREDFPSWWSRFALDGVRGCDPPSAGGVASADPVPGADAVAGALAVAAELGVTASSLTAEQKAEWLTHQEITALTREAAVVRVLVRSYRPPRGVFDLVAAEPDLVADPAARLAVAESAVVNSEVATWEPKQSIDYLKHTTLRDHLAEVWQVAGDDDRSLIAAARDRGLGSVSEAIEAVRPFFLRHHLRAVDPALPATGAS
jgi:hypothetical protein